jgi:hypothetical protein
VRDLFAIAGLSLIVVGAAFFLSGWFSDEIGISGDVVFLLLGPPLIVAGLAFGTIAVLISRKQKN